MMGKCIPHRIFTWITPTTKNARRTMRTIKIQPILKLKIKELKKALAA
jgi:hypothetical protein